MKGKRLFPLLPPPLFPPFSGSRRDVFFPGVAREEEEGKRRKFFFPLFLPLSPMYTRGGHCNGKGWREIEEK